MSGIMLGAALGVAYQVGQRNLTGKQKFLGMALAISLAFFAAETWRHL